MGYFYLPKVWKYTKKVNGNGDVVNYRIVI